MNFNLPPITVGWIIALLVLILCIIFVVTGQIPILIGSLIGGAAAARLL